MRSWKRRAHFSLGSAGNCAPSRAPKLHQIFTFKNNLRQTTLRSETISATESVEPVLPAAGIQPSYQTTERLQCVFLSLRRHTSASTWTQAARTGPIYLFQHQTYRPWPLACTFFWHAYGGEIRNERDLHRTRPARAQILFAVDRTLDHRSVCAVAHAGKSVNNQPEMQVLLEIFGQRSEIDPSQKTDWKTTLMCRAVHIVRSMRSSGL